MKVFLYSLCAVAFFSVLCSTSYAQTVKPRVSDTQKIVTKVEFTPDSIDLSMIRMGLTTEEAFRTFRSKASGIDTVYRRGTKNILAMQFVGTICTGVLGVLNVGFDTSGKSSTFSFVRDFPMNIEYGVSTAWSARAQLNNDVTSQEMQRMLHALTARFAPFTELPSKEMQEADKSKLYQASLESDLKVILRYENNAIGWYYGK